MSIFLDRIYLFRVFLIRKHSRINLTKTDLKSHQDSTQSCEASLKHYTQFSFWRFAKNSLQILFTRTRSPHSGQCLPKA